MPKRWILRILVAALVAALLSPAPVVGQRGPVDGDGPARAKGAQTMPAGPENPIVAR